MYYDLIPDRRKMVFLELKMLHLKKYIDDLENGIAAYKIQRGCTRWLNKTKCRDDTYGIRPRLDLTKSGLFGNFMYPNHTYKEF